ncbi:YdgH/BhsA/McbA-like domain containing protein [Pantoea sp. At-9b]|uniref:YdgH/BhsA/McbA-like domain containing protein n=1 Tax=Pantoea sp. (strain At-9b) TaxID=592316 RepID=UPI0001B3FE8F|nr:YdgH/BhsA/McbA-like domain containing protein [Pantoea sp. At-9b]ADU71669.1 protein of unknown function DUF1471 [Pantoea sp. At-9b]
MKKTMASMIALVTASLICGSAFAAKEISKADAKKYHKVGTVSSTKEHTSPRAAMEEISKKADEMGGKYFVITSGNEGDKVRATATVYK